MWAMIFLLGSGINIRTIRASLVALFFTTDSYAVLTGLGQGLMNSTILVRSIWVLPSLFLGVWIGSRKFESSNADIYKKVVIDNGRVIGCIMLGDRKNFNRINKAITSGEDIINELDTLLNG